MEHKNSAERSCYHILIVDDNEYNIYAMQLLLQKHGFECIAAASSGEEALKYVLDRDVDLILLDIQMPKMDGFETARLLKLTQRSAEIPIIFVTAVFKSDEFIQKGFEIGAVDYVLKPIEEFIFIKRVENYLRLTSQERYLKNANKLLISSKKKLKAIIDTVNVPICCSGFNNTILECNSQFIEIFGDGTPLDEDKNLLEFLPKEQFLLENRYNTEIKNSPNEKINFESEFEVKGTTRNFIISKSALFSEDGSTGGVTTVYIDITAQTQNEILLKQFNEEMEKLVKIEVSERLKIQNLFEEIIENTPDAMILLDEEERVLISNSAFERLLGYTKNEIKNRDICAQILESDNYERFVKGLLEFKKSGAEVHATNRPIECKAKNKSGKIIPVEILVSAIVVKDKCYSISTIRDLRERKAQEAKRLKEERIIEHNHKMILQGEMISAIAHQWRQPLNTISAIMLGIKMNLDEGVIQKKELKENIETVNKQIIFMNKTIEDFRSFFGSKNDDEWFDIKIATFECIDFLSYRANANNINIEHKTDKSVPLYGNKNAFRHIILNILNNSIDSIISKREALDGECGNIKIECDIKNAFAEIKIQDDGMGIKKEELEHIFSPNYSTKGEKGSGIGLYISRQIAKERFGGTIYIGESAVGALFVVRLSLLKDRDG